MALLDGRRSSQACAHFELGRGGGNSSNNKEEYIARRLHPSSGLPLRQALPYSSPNWRHPRTCLQSLSLSLSLSLFHVQLDAESQALWSAAHFPPPLPCSRARLWHASNNTSVQPVFLRSFLSPGSSPCCCRRRRRPLFHSVRAPILCSSSLNDAMFFSLSLSLSLDKSPARSCSLP